MTSEALRNYIVAKGFSEDIAQDVIIKYLKAKYPILYPKAWARKTCIRLKIKLSRQENGRVEGFDLAECVVLDAYSDPLKRAFTRQELDRVMTMKTPGPSKRRPWGWKRCQEDYETLQSLT